MSKSYIVIPLVIAAVLAAFGALGYFLGFLPELFILTLFELAKFAGVLTICMLIAAAPLRRGRRQGATE